MSTNCRQSVTVLLAAENEHLKLFEDLFVEHFDQGLDFIPVLIFIVPFYTAVDKDVSNGASVNRQDIGTRSSFAVLGSQREIRRISDVPKLLVLRIERWEMPDVCQDGLRTYWNSC